jgi:hypothetical protein
MILIRAGLIFFVVALAATAICAKALKNAAAVPAASRIQRLPDSLAQTIFSSFLQDSESLELPAFAAPLGPVPRTLLAVTNARPAGGSHGGFAAIALIDSAGGWRAVRIPCFNPDLWSAQLLAVLFENMDADSALETVIMATYSSGIGADGAKEWPYNFVLDWNGTGFVRLPKVERRIAGLATAAEVRRVLRKKGK